MNTFSRFPILVLIVFIFSLFVRYVDPVPVQTLRASLFDFYQRLDQRDIEKLPITIIDIDEKSISELGQWPWPRTILSALLEKISTLQPLVIGFDMVFPESDRLSPSSVINLLPKESRKLLADELSLENNDDNFVSNFSSLPIVLGTLADTIKDENQIIAPSKSNINWTNSPIEFLPAVSNRIANLEKFETAANGVGLLTIWPEVDGVVRRVPTLHQLGSEVWPAFGLELLRVALGSEEISVTVDKAGIDSVTTAGIKVPTNARGSTIVHFNQHQPNRFVSAVDVLNDRIEPELYTGHIFLIGTSASGLHDLKMTPMAQQMPGVEIWAQWLESALFGNTLERPNYARTAEILFLFFSGLILIVLTVKASARVSILVCSILTFACIGFSWWMYTNKLQLFDASFPVLSTGVLFAFLMLMKFWHEEQQRKQIKSAFSHYLSPSIVDELAQNPEQLKLGGEAKEITSLFTDLQGFTSLAEEFKPSELVNLINEYLDGICKIAIEHNGTIDKIIGDAVHVFFGAPKDQKEHAQYAVECALRIDAFCKQFVDQKKQQGFDVGETRIGVNSGQAIIGNFGGEARFDYTAYGDTVNLASRLESANQYLGSTICISESTVLLCKSINFRPIAKLTVKGKTESIRVYEPVAQVSELNAYLDYYCEIFSKLENQDSYALRYLENLYSQYPNDMVLKNLLASINQSGHISIQRELSEK